MNLLAADAEVSTLEDVMSRVTQGDNLLAAKVTLAWHLRQRDSARTLRLVQDIMPLVGGAGPIDRCDVDGDAPAAFRARAALAASEAAALFGDFDAAERWLVDARCHLAPRWDAQAQGDAWLVEFTLAKARGQRERGLDALDRGIAFFKTSGAPGRLAIARMWVIFELTLTQPDLDVLAQLRPPDGACTETCIAWDAVWSAARGLALSHGDPGTAAVVYQHASVQARMLGMVQLEAMCMINAGAAILDLGDYHLAAQCFDIAAQRAQATGWPALIAASDTRVAELLRDLGALEESRRILSEAIDVLAAGPRGIALAIAHAALARTLLDMGLVEESLEQVADAVRLYRDARSRPDLARILILQARALLAAGQAQQVITVLDEAKALIDDQRLDCLRVGLADVLANLHHRFRCFPPSDMLMPSAALHYAEIALQEGLRIAGWKPRAEQVAFLAERCAEIGDHPRAYDFARQALVAKERETAQKMRYPLALLRVRRRAEADAPPATAIGPANDAEEFDRT